MRQGDNPQKLYLNGEPPKVAVHKESAADVWAHVKDTTSVAVLEAFSERFKGSFYADNLARQRIKTLKLAAAKPVEPEPEITGTLTPLLGFASSIRAMVLSKDGKRLFTGSADGVIRELDLKAGKPIRSLKGHDDEVTAIDLSPDGTRLLSASINGQLLLWDVLTGQIVRSYRTRGGQPRQLSKTEFILGGAHFDSHVYGHGVYVWKVANFRSVTGLGNIGSFKVMPDQKHYFGGSSRGGYSLKKFFDENTKASYFYTLANHFIRGVDVLESSARIVVSTDSWGSDASLVLFDAKSRKQIWRANTGENRARILKMSYDGKKLFVQSGKNIKLWDTKKEGDKALGSRLNQIQ